MFWFSKDLNSVLNAKKSVKIKGVNFVIQKIDALSFLDGSKVMLQMYDVYKLKDQTKENINFAEKKIKEHMSEVLVAGTSSPKLVFKQDQDGVYVYDLFKDMDIANKLYEEIITYTYGKKKLNT